MRHLQVVALLASASCSEDMPAAPDAGGNCDLRVGTFHGAILPNGDGSEDRYYWLHVPASYRCEPMPLLVDFHGTASDVPEEAYQTAALIAFSDANDVIVVRPRSRFSTINGAPIYRWDQNEGDLRRNVTFATNLVADLEHHYSIDPARVYASGFSSGSNMAMQFLLDPHSPFKGLAAIAGGKWTPEALPPLAAGPRMYFATGYRDYLWPYARSTIADVAAAGLPADRVVVRRSGGGHDLYAWHFDELWHFLDGGVRVDGGVVSAPWNVEALPSAADVLALARDGSTLVAAGAHGRTWRRGAGGVWTVDLDRGTADYTALCFGAATGFVGGDMTAVVRNGSTWSADKVVPDYGQLGSGWVNTAVCRDDGNIVVGGYWSVAVTSDTGVHWSRFQAATSWGYEAQIAGAAVSSGATVLVGYFYIGVATGSATMAAPAPNMNEDWWNAATAVGSTVWAVGDHGAIVRSTNDGASWKLLASGTEENLYAVAFADASHGAAVGRRGTVLVTTDGGEHWSPRPLGKEIFLGAVAIDATTITVAGEDGLVATSEL